MPDPVSFDEPDLKPVAYMTPEMVDRDQPWKKAAFCHCVQRPKVTLDNRCYIGFSMTTEQYHYVQWHDWDPAKDLAGTQVAVELYDHRVDPDENQNVAGRSEYADRVTQMARQLKAGWEAAKPSF